jgi:hypothetical protein
MMDDLTLLYYRARQFLPILFFATRGISHLNSNQTDGVFRHVVFCSHWTIHFCCLHAFFSFPVFCPAFSFVSVSGTRDPCLPPVRERAYLPVNEIYTYFLILARIIPYK